MDDPLRMHGSGPDSNFMEGLLGDIFDGGGWERRVPVFLSGSCGVMQERQRWRDRRCRPSKGSAHGSG